MKKNTLLLCIAASLLLASCGTTAPLTDDPAVPQDTQTETAAETEDIYDPHLPDADYGGYEFTFAVRGDGSGAGAWHSTDLTSDGLNGDVLNDAIFERTSFIEDKYNVHFNLMWCGETSTALTGSEMSKKVTKSIMAGETAIDTILSSPYDTVGYMTNNYIIDLNTVDYLDLTKPWWDQNVNANLSFNNKIYFTTGELTIVDNKCTYAMIFSKRVADMYDIDSPYDAVRSGKWTLDKVIADSKIAASDLNGDGKMDENDRYGFVSWQDTCFGLIHSMGNTFGRINEKGVPELTFYTDRMVSTWEKIIGFASTDGFLARSPQSNFFSKLNLPSADAELGYYLENDQVLYAFSTIYTMLFLRDCTADFGIIPMPKYDEAQDRYYSTAHGYGTTLMSIPVTQPDTARTGLLLEAFAAKSMELVTPAFYDMTLTGKTVRDKDSAEMLDVIYSNKVYDIGYFFMWGNLTNTVMNAYNAKDINITSLYEKNAAKAQTDLESAQAIFGTLN